MTRPRTRNTLLLAAFFNEVEVRQLLATRSVHTADEVEARIEKWRKGRALLDQCPDWAAIENVVVQDPPADVQAKVDELATTENFKATVENLPYRVAVV